MANWLWLNLTLGIIAIGAIGAVLPVLALRHAEKQLVPVGIATNTRHYELHDKRELTTAGT